MSDPNTPLPDVPMAAPGETQHWLARPETIRRLWIALAAFLALLIALGFVFPVHGHYHIEEVPGFAAAVGFGGCVALVVVAKTLSALLKRPDTYYDD